MSGQYSHPYQKRLFYCPSNGMVSLDRPIRLAGGMYNVLKSLALAAGRCREDSRSGQQLACSRLTRRLSPVREILIIRCVGDLPEVSAIRSHREEVLLARARQIEGEHDALAVGRPARLKREGEAGACVQPDRVPAGTV